MTTGTMKTKTAASSGPVFYLCGWCDHQVTGTDVAQVRRDMEAHEDECPGLVRLRPAAWAAVGDGGRVLAAEYRPMLRVAVDPVPGSMLAAWADLGEALQNLARAAWQALRRGWR